MSELIDQYMLELESSKQDIKDAILNKGGTITGGLSSYAQSINELELGGGDTSTFGTLTETIIENGLKTYTPTDVDGWNEVNITVDVPIPTFSTQSKEITITENGTQTVTPDSGYDGLSSVEITVDVASSGGESKPQIPNGFRFTGGDLALVDFSQYDWSMVYDTSYFFQGCTHTTGDWTNFDENFNGEVLTGYRMFYNYKGSAIPLIDTTKVKNMGWMFGFCTNINTIPLIDTSLASTMEGMFQNCTYLTTIPLIDTSNVVNMRDMFTTCTHLTTIPLIDTSNVTDMSFMFQTCNSLESIPQLNTQNVTVMSHMFSTCTHLTTIPLIDTSNVTNMYRMFYACRELTSLPQIDTSKVTIFAQMFSGCTSLTSAPELDYSNVTGGMNNDASGVAYMFTGSGVKSIPNVNSKKVTAFGGYYSWVFNATNLESMGIIDCDSVTSVAGLLGNTLTGLHNLTNLGGFRNLGKANSVANTNGQYFLNNAPNLTYESVMNVINLLYDRATAGLSVLTLKLHPNHLAMLSGDDIAVATNKGWTLI